MPVSLSWWHIIQILAYFSSIWMKYLIPRIFMFAFWAAHHSASQEIIIKWPGYVSFKSDGDEGSG